MDDSVKKIIRSILTSSPVTVLLYQLEKDYANTIGDSIPYQKLGFNSVEHFLKSIPDTVRVRKYDHLLLEHVIICCLFLKGNW